MAWISLIVVGVLNGGAFITISGRTHKIGEVRNIKKWTM